MNKKERLIVTAIILALAVAMCCIMSWLLDRISHLFSSPWGDIVILVFLSVAAFVGVYLLIDVGTEDKTKGGSDV